MTDSTLFESLRQTLEQWASGRGLAVSLLGSDVEGGLAVNLTVLLPRTYETFYREHAAELGYPPEALGQEIRLEGGESVRVAGLDPIGEVPQLIVRSADAFFHLPKVVFDRLWQAAAPVPRA